MLKAVKSRKRLTEVTIYHMHLEEDGYWRTSRSDPRLWSAAWAAVQGPECDKRCLI